LPQNEPAAQLAPTASLEEGYYLWQVEGKPVSIYLKKSVTDKLRSALQRTSEASPEFGGFLLGHAEPDETGGERIFIEQVALFDCEYRYGSLFVLSPRDRQRFERKRDELGRSRVVGWFRSHARPGLYLDDKDYGLMHLYFSQPHEVVLLVKRGEANAAAGFFFWEAGDVRRHSSYKEFSLGRAEQAHGPVLAGPTTLEVRHQARRNVSARAIATGLMFVLLPFASYKAVRTFAALSVNKGAGSQVPQFKLTVQQAGPALRLAWDKNNPLVRKADHGHLLTRDGAIQKQLWLDGHQLSTGQLVFWPASRNVSFRLELYSMLDSQQLNAALKGDPQPQTDGKPEEQPIATAAAPSPGRSRPLEKVRDFANRAVARLTARPDLRQRISSEQNQRKQETAEPGTQARNPGVQKVATAEASITLDQTPRPPAGPRDIPNDSAPAASSETHSASAGAPNAPLTAPSNEPTTASVRQEIPTVPPLGGNIAAPAQPAEQHPTPAPPAAAATEPPTRAEPVTVEMSTEPVPPSAFRQIFQKIPVARIFQKKGRNRDGKFVPARAIAKKPPELPADLQLRGETTVDLLAKIDKSGRLEEVSYGSDVDARLAELAANAAGEWRFEPARRNGTGVPSELVLRFRFRDMSTQASR
jgi:hypothetical protein